MDDKHLKIFNAHQGKFGSQWLNVVFLPSVVEPRGLYRTDGKRPDAVTMIPWKMGKQLVLDATVVDSLAPSYLIQGFLWTPGTIATEAEARKIEKYSELIDNGYNFQPVALEVLHFRMREQ